MSKTNIFYSLVFIGMALFISRLIATLIINLDFMNEFSLYIFTNSQPIDIYSWLSTPIYFLVAYMKDKDLTQVIRKEALNEGLNKLLKGLPLSFLLGIILSTIGGIRVLSEYYFPESRPNDILMWVSLTFYFFYSFRRNMIPLLAK